ncbi:glucosidase [Modestobacter sp. I12A-02662]|uniref:MGH1-like glycoside hydrolase domain-containing protein n=1 Tax=Modestobacter sp. I12A-02662 TaxID=1730496 RepID=UPI0034DE9623
MAGADPERDRVRGFDAGATHLADVTEWYRWGPYVSERAWGTVREDYSADGGAWDYFPHDHARSRAYRWSEDGLAAVCDWQQRLCLGLALWNGADPILKERLFGLTGGRIDRGNHGEDVKEYYWYVDAVPSHSWLHWRYHYPQRRFPYDDLVAENARRGPFDPEYELLDTGVFDDDRYWAVDVQYAKGGPDDLLMRIVVRNAGPDEATLHVLPTLWFRNTWSWDVGAHRPEIRAADGDLVASHPDLGDHTLTVGTGPDGRRPDLVFCANDTNAARLFAATNPSPFPKDGINDYVVAGTPTVDPAARGTKASAWYRLRVAAGGTAELRLRLRPSGDVLPADPLGSAFDDAIGARRREADAFYAALVPSGTPDEVAAVARSAFAGLIWSKQFYAYDVGRWLDGDPAQPPPPPGRARNRAWRHLALTDVISMPDTWEYPWFAAWDLAFHCVAWAHIDPAFAKYQLRLLCRDGVQSPDGALPAYEWRFDDTNPPVHAWATVKVWSLDGERDTDFLRFMFERLGRNFDWWVSRHDSQGDGIFTGGFLGLDNISVFDRSNLPFGGELEQADATGWMGLFTLSMVTIAQALARSDPAYEAEVSRYLDYFAKLARAVDEKGLWSERDQFFFDVLRMPSGESVPFRIDSLVGVVPALAAAVITPARLEAARATLPAVAEFLPPTDAPARSHRVGVVRPLADRPEQLISLIDEQQLRGVFQRVADEGQLLSPYGVRSLSAEYRDNPYVVTVDSHHGSIDYQPAESTTTMFGGNSNWRGPVWAPLHYLLVDVVAQYADHIGPGMTVEFPHGSGQQKTLTDVMADLRSRFLSLFTVGPDGRRPCSGWVDRLQRDPAWNGQPLFFEYFHGDNGAGLGASHQTGWTALVADLVCGMRTVTTSDD